MDINILINTINSTIEHEEDKGNIKDIEDIEDKENIKDKEDGEDKEDIEDATELETAKNQILGIAQPQIQRTTIDELNLSTEDQTVGKAIEAYEKVIQARKQLDFEKRMNAKAKGFREDIKKGVGKVKVDPTLSNRPNKRR